MAKPPAPPTTKERRRHPRHELYAWVELVTGGESVVLPVKNMSVSGLLLSADGNDLSKFPVGSDQAITIFDPGNPALKVPVRARIIRHAADGLALTWTAVDTILEVGRLLKALRK